MRNAMRQTSYFLLLSSITILAAACAGRQTGIGTRPDVDAGAPPAAQAELGRLRAEIAAEKLTFDVGYNEAMNIPLSTLAATKPPAPDAFLREAKAVNARAAELVRLEQAEIGSFLKRHPEAATEVFRPVVECPDRSAFDWRQSGKITGIRHQDGCGSCWDFAALGAFESSWAIRNNQLVDGSEQHVLDCAAAGTCQGGWYMPVFEFLIKQGVAKESDYPYTASDGTCKTNVTKPYRAAVWGYVDSTKVTPSVDAIKRAICDHGGIAVTVRVTPLFRAYRSGVFNEHDPGAINHAVDLIGWDDSKQAWIMRNSWGPNWGDTAGFGTERGYMWIKYDSNRIGSTAAWVDARYRLIKLSGVFDRQALKPLPLQ